jgi:hypothetical protein
MIETNNGAPLGTSHRLVHYAEAEVMVETVEKMLKSGEIPTADAVPALLIALTHAVLASARPPRAGPRRKETPLPEGWEPPRDLIRELMEQYPDVQHKSEFDRFTRYYREDGGKRGDWALCWRRWVERAAERLGAKTGGDR